MADATMEKGAGKPPTFKLSLYLRRPEYKPAVSVYQPISNCGHPRPIVRNVTTLNGAAAYVCRECFTYLRNVEFRAVIRGQVAALFRNWWPGGINPRAVLWGRGAA